MKTWDAYLAEPATWDLIVSSSDVTGAGGVRLSYEQRLGYPHLEVDDFVLDDLETAPVAIATYEYDTAGRVRREEVAEGTRNWVYSSGQLVGYYQDFADPAADLSSSLTYDSSGRVSSVDTNGVTTSYTYDAAGQLLGADDGTTDRVWTYDDLGRRTSAADGTVETTYTYDAASQLVSSDCVSGPCTDVTYSYDRAGRRLSEDHGGEGDRVFTYSPNGLLATAVVTAGGDTVSTSRKYGPNGKLNSFTTDSAEGLTSQLLSWNPLSWELLESTNTDMERSEHLSGLPSKLVFDGVAAISPSANWMGSLDGDDDPFGLADPGAGAGSGIQG